MMNDTPKEGDFCWTELATPNVQAAKDFYGKVFGWEFSDHKTPDMTYTMIKNKNKEFGGMWGVSKEKQKEIPPHWLAYILVKNLEGSLEKAKKHGAKIVKPASEAGEYGRFAIITDPTGAHIALWESLQNK